MRNAANVLSRHGLVNFYHSVQLQKAKQSIITHKFFDEALSLFGLKSKKEIATSKNRMTTYDFSGF